MGDLVTRFRLETTQFDSKLRDASKSLSEISRKAASSGKDFDKFTRANVEAARALGKTASGATNVKDKVKDLVGAYNDAARAYNALTRQQQQTPYGKALSESLVELKQRISDAKQEMYGLSDAAKKSGGLFDGDKLSGMLQVFGGNMMTKGLELATGAAMSFVHAIQDAAVQGIEMAKAGEGIRMAFERLNQPDLLDKLREATHGTVTDLELMKQAVKFSDFRLNLDEMGTLLAFAQQKAKDTGQSVDYMVDSIVTGLGRQSLMILDNLGLSASEIRERMKESGDMTKAVASIIKDQMAAAGEYVQTAADKAAQADVELKNAMEEFGRTLLPLEQQGTQMWTSLQIGAINLLNDGIKPLVPAILEIKDVMAGMYTTISTSGAWEYLTASMKTAAKVAQEVSGPLGKVYALLVAIGRSGNGMKAAGAGAALGGVLGDVPANGGQLDEVVITPPKITVPSTGGRGGGVASTTLSPLANIKQGTGKINYGQYYTAYSNRQEEIPVPVKPTISEEAALEMYGQLKQFAPPDPLALASDGTKNVTKQAVYFTDAWKTAAQAVQTVGSALAGLEDPAARIAGTVAQAVANIALGYSQAMLAPKDPLSWIAFGAMGLAQMLSTISAIKSATSGYSEGGRIPGNSYSGDNQIARVNAGELILNRAQQGNLASQLQGGGLGALELHARLRGEDILLSTNNTSRRMGRGQFVTTRSY